MRGIISILGLLSIIATTPLFAFEKEKATSIYQEKLAISDFGNASSFDHISKGLTDELVALLVKSKRFDIMEREKLAAILKEQEFQLSGAVDESTAVKVGKLIGVRYFIFGSITSADATHTEEKVVEKTKDKDTGKVFYQEYIDTSFKGHVTVTTRVVDIETGEIMLARTVDGYGDEKLRRAKEDKTFLQSILSALASKGDEEAALAEYYKQVDTKVVNQAVNDAAYQLVSYFLKEFPLTGYVLSRTEDDDFLIDLGTERGLNSEVNLKVQGKAEVIKHPVTGEVLKVSTGTLGYLKVIDLGNATSVAKLVKGKEEEVKPGAKVEVVDPIFIWHRALASFLVPGLGQMLEKRWGSGIAFLLGESLMLGGAYYFYYRSTDAYLTQQDLLDNTDWKKDRKGDQYANARNSALAGMWVFLVLETGLHIWSTLDGGYPAEKNDVFAQKGTTWPALAYREAPYEKQFFFYRTFRF